MAETNETTSRLPAEALERRGANAAAIKTLSQRAGELSGPEVAAIAQGIAGPNVGQQTRLGAAGDRGDNAVNRSEADDRLGAERERTPMNGRPIDSNATPTNETATDAETTEPPTDVGFDTVDAGQ